MSIELSNKEYEMARDALRDGLRGVAEATPQIDLKSSAFRALFKRDVLKLYERILDDPKTYEI